MKHAVEIAEPGVANTVQDGGRRGYRQVGVPLSGALDAVLLACANRLLGNPADAAAIEIPLSGPTLRATGDPVRVALAGAIAAKLLRVVGTRIDIQALGLDEGTPVAVQHVCLSCAAPLRPGAACAGGSRCAGWASRP